MAKSLIISILFFFFIGTSIAQVHEIPLNRKNSKQNVLQKSKSGVKYTFSHDIIYSKSKSAKDGSAYTNIWLKGSYPNGFVGEPNIPAYMKLILIPKGSSPNLRILSNSEQLVDLKEKGINKPIYPNQPSVSKNQDTSKVEFVINKSSYSKKTYSNNPIATIEVLGNLRSATIARLVVNPIDYNPGDGILKVYNDIEVEVNYSETNQTVDKQILDPKTYSPYFETVYKSLGQSNSSAYEDHPDLTKYPVKMLIVSDRLFEETLQPFIQWKTSKGFTVKCVYTDEIGTTADKIKTYIQQEYNSATNESPAPTFLVIVGDVDKVPASATGSATGKQTDLYYASVDQDMFPDMYYGRLSAVNTTQLGNIVNKILYYEKYQFADPSYLNRVTLIAGVDGTWNYNVGQPTIKYGTANYFNQSKGYTTVNEYGITSDPNNPNAQQGYTGCYDSERIGVGIINYTAHCNIGEWSNPYLSNSAIGNFTNLNKYPLAIGNCCLSGDFGSSECIGEAWIRAQNKGAVTYIGSSPNTFWLEDFYWSVGAFPLVGDNNGYVPTFQETTTGVYDAPFVSKYVSSGGLVFAGNLAVTEVNLKGYPTSEPSSLYYWQAYNVLGDPSLIPYFTEAEANQVLYSESIVVGQTSMNVTALENSYVAISKNNQLLGTKYYTTNSEETIPINNLNDLGDIIITITRPQTIPIIDTIQAISPTGPFLMLNSFIVDDSSSNNNGKVDYNETFNVELYIKNIGIGDATNVKVKVEGTDEFINIQSSDSISIPDIPYNVNNTQLIPNAFVFKTTDSLPDQHIANFTLKFYSDQGSWSSKLKIKLNYPTITIGNISIDDSLPNGNNNKILNTGESCKAYIQVNNIGHSLAKDLTFSISIPDSIKKYISINSILNDPISIDGESFTSIPLRINVGQNLSKEIIIPLNINVTIQEPNKLSNTFSKEIIAGDNNSINIKNDTVVTCFSYFYDSGGKTGNYNSSENYTITFASASESSFLQAAFSEFTTELNYDFLYIYDGASTNSPQISGSPFSGSTLPASIISSGKYLTFKWHSDSNNEGKGWAATIECVNPQIPSCIVTPTPSNGATNVTTRVLRWIPQTYASFYDVYIGKTETDLSYCGRVDVPYFSFKPEKSTTYYWEIVPLNYLGSNNSCSTIWHFTTDTISGEILMSNSTISVDTMLFYDSGGPTSSYKNSENYTITLLPKYQGNSVNITFSEFDLEYHSSCAYDKVTIYNGLNTTSPIIGSYCGTSLPSSIQASNASGALTFSFKSDGEVVGNGWKAVVRSVGVNTFKTINIKIQDNNGPIPNSSININGTIKYTNLTGDASFSVLNGDVDIVAYAAGYKEKIVTVPSDQTNSPIIITLDKLSSVNLHISDSKTLSNLPSVKIIALNDSSYTNSLGNATIYLTPGTYPLNLTLKGYSSYSQELVVGSNTLNLDIKLSPQKHKIAFMVKDVASNPVENATIIIGDTTITTNSTGTALGFKYSDSYSVTISKTGYITQNMSLLITDSLTLQVTLDPVQTVNNVEFTLFKKGPKFESPLNYNSIELFTNNIAFSKIITNSEGRGTIQLLKGDYTFNINKVGFIPIVNKGFVVSDVNNIVQDTIFQKTFPVTFNVTSQSGPIENAAITLNGYPVNYTNSLGQLEFPVIGYEKFLKYTVQHDGFYNIEGTIDVVDPLTVDILLISTSDEIITLKKSIIYPNPATNDLFIKSEQRINKISVINTMGSILLTKEFNPSNEQNISIGHLSPGLYILIIYTENSVPEKTLIIKM